MMPRTAAGVLAIVAGAAVMAGGAGAGCGFDADYRGGTFRCSDGVCPSGLACVAGTCVAPGDARATIDARVVPDARAARTCGDPDDVARGAAHTITGTTSGGSNHVSAMCGALVMNGPDDVFRVTAQAGDKLDVSITGDSVVRAYVVAACAAPPQTPVCEGGVFTEPGVIGISLTSLPAGTHYILVDSENAALGGSYSVTVDLRP
jgi:hypothetical protein